MGERSGNRLGYKRLDIISVPVVGKVGSERESIHQPDLLAVQFHVLFDKLLAVAYGKAIDGFAALIDQDTSLLIGLGQLGRQCIVSDKLGIGIDGQNANRSRLVPFDFDARRIALGAQSRYNTHASGRLGALKPVQRKASFAGKVEASWADHHNISFEQANHFDVAVEQRVAKADLHEHEQYGKADAGRRQQKLAGTGCKIFPS